MIDAGQYFTINRARQYGKTTTLLALAEYLQSDHIVVSLDFQLFSSGTFKTENTFSLAFAKAFIESWKENKAPYFDEINERLNLLNTAVLQKRNDFGLQELFENLSGLCRDSRMPVVLIIDEADCAADSQVFLDFLSQLRGYYIKRRRVLIFQSVILAGVYDPAADFLVNMNFSKEDIAGMLVQYEQDHNTGMDIEPIATLLYDYTSGYPFLVSRICKLLDERIAGSEGFSDKSSAWTREGLLKAVRILLTEPNMLFDSLIHKLRDYPELDQMLRDLLFKGKEIAYVIGIPSIGDGSDVWICQSNRQSASDREQDFRELAVQPVSCVAGNAA